MFVRNQRFQNIKQSFDHFLKLNGFIHDTLVKKVEEGADNMKVAFHLILQPSMNIGLNNHIFVDGKEAKITEIHLVSFTEEGVVIKGNAEYVKEQLLN